MRGAIFRTLGDREGKEDNIGGEGSINHYKRETILRKETVGKRN